MGPWYVGDLHGSVRDVARLDMAAAELGITDIVQVGDFGARWGMGPCPIHRYFSKRARKNRPGPTWWTPGGNHENWDTWDTFHREQGVRDRVELAPGCYYVPRGQSIVISGMTHLFIGGAESTDRPHRIEGKTWWARETPTYEEFCSFADALDERKPEVVVSHDAPTRVPIYRNESRINQPTPRNLDNVLKCTAHRPRLWVFGHHHVKETWFINDILFACCGLGTDDWDNPRKSSPDKYTYEELMLCLSDQHFGQ